MIGKAFVENAGPEQQVMISEFYIDRYPVTRVRYDQCVAAGVCPAPTSSLPPGFIYQNLPANGVAFGMSLEGRTAFCNWDGGYEPTEFQWEKAARGPWPSTVSNAWGNQNGDCNHHYWTGCQFGAYTTDSYPMAVSVYGVRLQGSFEETTGSRLTIYRTYPVPLPPDPTGDPGGTRVVVRGDSWDPTQPAFNGNSAVVRGIATGTRRLEGFRCAY